MEMLPGRSTSEFEDQRTSHSFNLFILNGARIETSTCLSCQLVFSCLVHTKLFFLSATLNPDNMDMTTMPDGDCEKYEILEVIGNVTVLRLFIDTHLPNIQEEAPLALFEECDESLTVM
jgi:hypothetical protein